MRAMQGRLRRAFGSWTQQSKVRVPMKRASGESLDGGASKQPRERWASATERVTRKLTTAPRRYHVLAHSAQEELARRLVEFDSTRFEFHETTWGTFPDGTDNIKVGGFANNRNLLRGEHVVFLGELPCRPFTLALRCSPVLVLNAQPASTATVSPSRRCTFSSCCYSRSSSLSRLCCRSTRVPPWSAAL